MDSEMSMMEGFMNMELQIEAMQFYLIYIPSLYLSLVAILTFFSWKLREHTASHMILMTADKTGLGVLLLHGNTNSTCNSR